MYDETDPVFPRTGPDPNPDELPRLFVVVLTQDDHWYPNGADHPPVVRGYAGTPVTCGLEYPDGSAYTIEPGERGFPVAGSFSNPERALHICAYRRPARLYWPHGRA